MIVASYDERQDYASGNLTSTGDKLVFSPTFPVDVYRYGVIITTDVAASNNVIIALDKRPVVKSDTGRVELSRFEITAAESGNADAGDLYYKEIAPVQVNPGEELVVEVVDAATAGAAVVFLHYQMRPFQPGRAKASGPIA